MATSRRCYSGLSGLVGDSDTEDSRFEQPNAMPTPDSATENMPLARKGRGKAKTAASKIVKAKAPERRASGAKSAPAKRGRPALKDKTNELPDANETEEVDEFDGPADMTAMSGDELHDSILAVKQKKVIKPARNAKAQKAVRKTRSSIGEDIQDGAQVDTKKVAVTKKAALGKPVPAPKPRRREEVVQQVPESMMEVDEGDDEVEDEPVANKAAASKRAQKSKAQEQVIQETQESMIEGDDGDVDMQDELSPQPVVRQTNAKQSKSQARPAHIPRRRAGSASDSERDPNTRRKLGEMTKKLENLDLKYRNLREIGITQADQKFELLRKQHEQSKKASSALIASLKAEAAVQSAQLKQTEKVRRQLEKQELEVQLLHTKNAELSTSLSEARIENKTLSAKLAANRAAEKNVEGLNGRVPSSAVKGNGGIRMVGSVEAVQTAQEATLKQELFTDFTGLIIRSVKKEGEENIYDCIQTGRNGTLHFKLAVGIEKSTETYDESQCIYIPQLDPSRDRELMEMLPEYLVEEITFPRPHAAKFYARVMKALTEK